MNNIGIIQSELNKHYNEVLKHYPAENILGIFLYGSQNYNLATENSDVDTKAIIIPDFKDLCLRRPVSKELHLDNGEHCEVKDIREMCFMFRKQNINFIEILFTDYYIINPKYRKIWKDYFIANNEKIAKMNKKRGIMSMTGQAINAISRKPFDNKAFSTAMRIYYTMLSYIADKPYKECLNIYSQGYIIATKIKRYKMGMIPVTVDDRDLLSRNLRSLEERIKDYNFIDEEANEIMDEGCLVLIKENIKSKIEGEIPNEERICL